MVSHKAVLGSLEAYADGTLPDSERASVAAHLRTCAECGASLREIHRLDHVLEDLPTMPAVPFSRFWSRLEPRLPNHAQKRAPWFRPGRVAAGLALAVLASLVGVVALASDGTMPDSPLYPVKHLRQHVQVILADPHERPRLEIFLGGQRLNEALVMLKRGRDDLAVASLKDSRALLVDAAPGLKNTPGGQSDTDKIATAIARLKSEITDVSAANREPDSSTPEDIAAVDNAVQDAESAVTNVETSVGTTAPAGVESPSAAPVSEPPAPEPSASAAPSDAAPTEAAATSTP